MNLDALLGYAEDVVRKATARGAEQAEAYVGTGAGIDVDLEAGRLAGSGHSASFGGSVRVQQGDRIGFAYFTSLERATQATELALQQTRLAPQLAMRWPDPEPLPTTASGWSDELAALDAAMATATAKDLLVGADLPEATVSGGVGIQWGAEALANSHGVAVAGRDTMMQAYASLVLPDGDRNVNAWDTVSAHGRVDGVALASGVAQTVQDLRNPAPASTGRADVVLRPDAGAELVTGLVLDAVDGDTAMRGKSFWSDALGKPVGHPGLHITDAPLHPQAIGTTAYDGEGRAVRDQPILEGGVLATWLFDTRDAARHQQEPTGHAVREGFKSPPGTGAHHVVLDADTRLAMDGLIGGIDDGYLVDSVLGAHTANATTGDFSVTAPNVWRIRNGRLDGACKEVAIGGNLPELLHRLDAVGHTPKAMSGQRIPAMRIRNVQVSA